MRLLCLKLSNTCNFDRVIRRWFAIVTFKFVDRIQWIYHSNETSFAEFLHGIFHVLGFYKLTLGFFLANFSFWPLWWNSRIFQSALVEDRPWCPGVILNKIKPVQPFLQSRLKWIVTIYLSIWISTKKLDCTIENVFIYSAPCLCASLSSILPTNALWLCCLLL